MSGSPCIMRYDAFKSKLVQYSHPFEFAESVITSAVDDSIQMNTFSVFTILNKNCIIFIRYLIFNNLLHTFHSLISNYFQTI